MTHLGFERNEYGALVSSHKCSSCGAMFTVCPPKLPDEDGWDGCLAETCESYDVMRDFDLYFDDPEAYKKLHGLRVLRSEEIPED